MSDRVSVKISDFVAEVAMTRPEKMNALDMKMFTALGAAGDGLKTEPTLRAVVLHGQGGNFCAGIDTSIFPDLVGRIDDIRTQMLSPPAGEAANLFQKPAHVWQELDVPVIAALTGAVFGGGAQIALGADFRFARADIRLSIMETKWGLIPDMGISQSLPKLMRADQAKELMMTARVIDGHEALALGLVTRLCEDPLAEARAFAAKLAARSPDAIKGCKRLVERVWSEAPPTGLHIEAEIQAPIIAAPNQIEAVMANVEKRTPKFT